MRFLLSVTTFALALGLTLGLGAATAQAQSCSAFVDFVSFDPAAEKAQVKFVRGSKSKYFPKPEGSNTTTDKIPKKCTRKVTRYDEVEVTPTGGRMTVTQFRMNFSGKMLNDLEDENWVTNKIKELQESDTSVVGIFRAGKTREDPPELTTVYLPITDEELADIARIDAQAEDVD